LANDQLLRPCHQIAFHHHANDPPITLPDLFCYLAADRRLSEASSQFSPMFNLALAPARVVTHHFPERNYSGLLFKFPVTSVFGQRVLQFILHLPARNVFRHSQDSVMSPN
jgi:hypothetical protein